MSASCSAKGLAGVVRREIPRFEEEPRPHLEQESRANLEQEWQQSQARKWTTEFQGFQGNPQPWVKDFMKNQGSNVLEHPWTAEYAQQQGMDEKWHEEFLGKVDWESEFQRFQITQTQNESSVAQYETPEDWIQQFNAAETDTSLKDWEHGIDNLDLDPATKPLVDYAFALKNPFRGSQISLEEALTIRDKRLSDGVLALEGTVYVLHQALLEQNPQDYKLWLLLGETLTQNEQDTQAIVALEHAVQLSPASLDALMALAVCYTNEGQELSAITTLERWTRTRIGHVDPTPTGTSQTSTWLLSEIQRLSKVDPELQNALGLCFYNQGDVEKAIDCFHAALAVRPDHVAYNRLVAVLQNSGRSEEAIDAYFKALEIKPGFVRARYNLGIASFNVGCYKEAAGHLLSALLLNVSCVTTKDSDHVWEALRRVFIMVCVQQGLIGADGAKGHG